MLQVNENEVRLLAPIVDKFYGCEEKPFYQPLVEGIIDEYVYPVDSLVDIFRYFYLAPPKELEEKLDFFFSIPYEQMYLYAVPKPLEQLKDTEAVCPSLKEGPYPWQTIFAQWRLTIQQ